GRRRGRSARHVARRIVSTGEAGL
ncbi:MAG: hypothetical protein KJ042_09585, partial [Deltaproteobacteria bacterium]|nr:hypothetical protein [Deltaproteobacteria bacterium]